MHHKLTESQKFLMSNDSDDTFRKALVLMESVGENTAVELMKAVVAVTGVDRFDSFSCVEVSKKSESMGIDLLGFAERADCVAFYKNNHQTINNLLIEVVISEETTMEKWVGDAVEENSMARGAHKDFAKVFEYDDKDNKHYEEVVSSVVSRIVKDLGLLYAGICQNDFTKLSDKGKQVQAEKSLAYTYLCYEPISQYRKVAHALVDIEGHNAFVADARFIDKVDSFNGDDLTTLPTRYSRVKFFVENANIIHNWIEEQYERDPINTDFDNWVLKIKNDDIADIFEECRADMGRIIYSVVTDHPYFDEIIDVLMLHIIGQVSRDFAHFSKCNGGGFNVTDNKVYEAMDKAIYNNAYKQAKADILKALQAV